MNKALATALLGSLIWTAQADACGLEWGDPSGRLPFESIDSQGHLLLVEKLGNIVLSEASVGEEGHADEIPIYALFMSESHSASPLGLGWQLPLLQSHLVQVGANPDTFRLIQPDGMSRLFWRTKNDSKLLEGQGDWKASIEGSDTVYVWAPCGAKLTYKNGKISQMVINGKTLDYVYQGGEAVEIRRGDTSVFRITKSKQDSSKTIEIGRDEPIEIFFAQRPRVQAVNGMNIVNGFDSSLCKITGNGNAKSFEYGTDDRVRPTIKIEDRLIVWNPEDGRVVRDGPWTYESTAGKFPADRRTIKRRNDDGENESWHLDDASGKLSKRTSDGVTTISTWFVNGILANRLRAKKQVAADGTAKVLESYVYNEKGQILRKEIDGLSTEYKYDQSNGQLLERTEGEKRTVYHREEDGSMEMETFTHGKRSVYRYSKEGRILSGVHGGQEFDFESLIKKLSDLR